MSHRPQKYKNPPIQEAVCEIHLALPKPLTPEEINKIGPVWKAAYPNQQSVEEKVLRVEIALGSSKTSEEAVGRKLVARSAEGLDLCQLAPSLLAVNRLPPYAGWEESFRSTIIDRFQEAHSILGFGGISNVVLRYINRIEVPESPIVWDKWFKAGPPIPSSLAGDPQVFQSHTQLQLDQGMTALINFGVLQGVAAPTVMLDIAVVFGANVPIKDLRSTLDKVHSPHNVLFESYLTDSLRSIFHPL